MTEDEPKEYLIRNIVVEAVRVKNDIEIMVSTRKKIAKAGDWIVTHKDGKKLIVSGKEFANKYMPLRGES